ncbi:MAG: methionine synthase [Bacteroidaceae bacterium]|nr:methionine synthase [Bacteroidaceae bacterium]
MDIRETLKERILVLDGAMGTMIQQYKLTEEDFRGERFVQHNTLLKGNNDLLVLTRPDVIEAIHEKYLQAGADIIETNTFNANAISQGDYGCQHLCDEMNRAAVRLARRVADRYSTPEKPRFVVASVGPTSRTCSISPDVENPAMRNITFDELVVAYTGQMVALIDEGVDALLCETVFDTLNVKAALYAADEAMKVCGKEVPIMLSLTVADAAGRTLSGQTIEAFLASVLNRKILSVGLNCSFGASQMKPFIKQLSKIAPCYVSAYPNAGLPNALGGYDQTPTQMAECVKEYIDEELVNIIGGCCGTTNEYIAEFPALVEGREPRKPAEYPTDLWLSGLEPLIVKPDMNFINIGERCNVAGSRKFLRLIKEKNYAEALKIARMQVDDGAQILDINMDDGLLDAMDEMKTFLNLLGSEPEIARVPIMVDSSDWSVITTGLKCLQGRAIVNSISLKEGEEMFIARAKEIKCLGAAVVVMAFDEDGQATTYERKIEVCARAYKLLTEKAGLEPCEIIFDPNILAIATGIEEHAAYGVDFIRACEWISKNLPAAHISGGVSNLSFSFRGNNYVREALHAVFLYHAISAGMDMGIVNPQTSVQYEDIPLEIRNVMEDVIFNRGNNATEKLIAIAQELKDKEVHSGHHNDETWRTASVEERLKTALLKGVADWLETDLAEAVDKYGTAVAVIGGPLMDGMGYVGELFGNGKLFLPQVVKTARTMKQAVSILQPLIEKQNSERNSSAGKILIATVKGDVHDIGKNIAGVVMGCNGYEIFDLGVMVPAERIVEEAKANNVDMVILSGLITPSLEEMITVVKSLKKAGMSLPVLIAGATTSPMHTALKIAPEYDGLVVHVKDVSQNVLVAAELLGDAARRQQFTAQVLAGQEEMRNKATQKVGEELRSLEDARRNRLDLFGNGHESGCSCGHCHPTSNVND